MTKPFHMDSEKLIYRKKKDPLHSAIWVLTPKAAAIADRLLKKLGSGNLFIGPSIKNPPSGAVSFLSLSESVGCEFHNYSSHIFIMAAGIVTRVIAPFLNGKLSDPAVVVVDDHGMFAISLLSGHLGGANELACRVAEYLNALPVITTATDISRLPAIDTLARRHELMIENPEVIKTVHMALLKGHKIRFHDPMNILQKDLSDWVEPEFSDSLKSRPGVFVDYHTAPLSSQWLVLRPKLLSIGVGCNRNTNVREIFDFLKNVFLKFSLSINSIENMATIEAKADEQAILELALILNVPVRFFSRNDLSGIDSVPTPSEVVKKHMGVASICEAAAILASNHGKLLVPKQVTKNVTIAVGVRPFMW